MAIDLILLEDVENLGSIGDHVTVANGYARNFLIPRRKGAPATKATLRVLEARKVGLQKEYQECFAVAESLAARINQESVTIPVQATEDDKLYGSVAAQQIIESLAEKGIELQSDTVVLEEPIQELGVYNVDIRLHDDVQAALKVWVVRA